jgi:BMFP domain-containing protein YqiC
MWAIPSFLETKMFEANQLNDLAQRLTGALPQDLRAMKGDLEHNFKAILQASLGRMNLVTREEFDVQRNVLLRAREQLEALEARVKALEALVEKE